jgi:hypothetical protein
VVRFFIFFTHVAHTHIRQELVKGEVITIAPLSKKPTYPVQLAMLIPFLRAGAWLFRDQRFAISLFQIVALIRANVWNAITTLWIATMHASADRLSGQSCGSRRGISIDALRLRVWLVGRCSFATAPTASTSEASIKMREAALVPAS